MLSLYLPLTLSSRSEVDLAFVAPAGGSALPAARAFDLAVQASLLSPARRYVTCSYIQSHMQLHPVPVRSCPDPLTQLVAHRAALSIVWFDDPGRGTRSVLYSGVVQPNQTRSVSVPFSRADAALLRRCPMRRSGDACSSSRL
jgi:hypothetical protein